jgi:hypothetical protein
MEDSYFLLWIILWVECFWRRCQQKMGSSWIAAVSRNFWAASLVLITICTVIGYVSTITFEAPDYEKIFQFGRKK